MNCCPHSRIHIYILYTYFRYMHICDIKCTRNCTNIYCADALNCHPKHKQGRYYARNRTLCIYTRLPLFNWSLKSLLCRASHTMQASHHEMCFPVLILVFLTYTLQMFCNQMNVYFMALVFCNRYKIVPFITSDFSNAFIFKWNFIMRMV